MFKIRCYVPTSRFTIKLPVPPAIGDYIVRALHGERVGYRITSRTWDCSDPNQPEIYCDVELDRNALN